MYDRGPPEVPHAGRCRGPEEVGRFFACDLQVGDDHRIAVPGTFIAIPAGVAHTTSVVGDEPARMLMILSNPARALQMVDTLEQAFANGEPDPETVGLLLAQIDTELLAPTAS